MDIKQGIFDYDSTNHQIVQVTEDKMVRENIFVTVLMVLTLVATITDALPPKAIAGGTQAAPGEFPYQVGLRVNGRFHCGGTIITSRHILTAAHCVSSIPDVRNIVVVTGSVQASAGEPHAVADAKYHAGYKFTSTSPNDIAIIVLAKDIVFNQFQQPIALPSGPTPSNVLVDITGWGGVADQSPTVEYLQKTQVLTLTAEQCQQHLAQASIIWTHQICSYSYPGRGTCRGDSGGPLAYGGQVVGVVSWGIGCGRAGLPDVYSSVYHYVDWIKRVVAST